MKKLIYICVTLLLFAGAFAPKAMSQDTNNVVLELCTGTWCPWCPCGHAIADNILNLFPNTLVLEYHGYAGTGDPWINFNGNQILGSLGLSSYPTGVVGRRTGVIDRGAWTSQTAYQRTFLPDVTIGIVKTYNPTTRALTVTANVTSLRTIDTTVNINFTLAENNLIYSQSGNSSCTGGSNYVHKHVVRDMVNGHLGEQLSTGTWASGTVKSKTWNYTVPAGWVATNLEIGVFAYFVNGTLNNQSIMLNSKKAMVDVATGIGSETGSLENYSLSQNYPNPFNPSTNIKFSIPKNAQTSLKIYDVLGNEVSTYFNQFLNAGTYSVEFDGGSLSSGIYYYKLISGDFSETKRMMLVK